MINNLLTITKSFILCNVESPNLHPYRGDDYSNHFDNLTRVLSLIIIVLSSSFNCSSKVGTTAAGIRMPVSTNILRGHKQT